MRLFGFNISRAPRAQRSITPALQRSFDPDAWLRGEESEPAGSVLSNAYQQVVWVYRAINVLAEQVANIPFLFSAGDRGRESLITTGPLLDFYNRPSPGMNRFQYWEMRVIWLMLRGECFRVPIFSDGRGGWRVGGRGGDGRGGPRAEGRGGDGRGGPRVEGRGEEGS